MGARFDRFRVATAATLRGRYGSTALGIAWLPIGPVVLVVTLVVALSRILGQSGPALELVLGLILWNFFAAGTSEGLRGLSSQISAAQRSGDEALIERLVREKTALSRALHRGVSESD